MVENIAWSWMYETKIGGLLLDGKKLVVRWSKENGWYGPGRGFQCCEPIM